MNYVIKYILNLNLILKYYFLNKNLFKKYKSKSQENNIVLVECNNSKSHHIAYSYISNICAKIYNAEIKSLNINLINNNFYLIILKLFNRLKIFHFSIYSSFNSNSLICIKNNKLKFNKKFKNKKEILNYKLYGVLVGDLIYDSYLRYNELHTVDLNDQKFLEFTENCYNYFVSVKNIFDKNKVKAVILSHTVYLPAFAGRYALKKKIDFYNCGITHLVKLSKKNFFNDIYENYKKEFNNFPKKEKDIKIAIAKKEIKRKLDGKVSTNMENLKFSPFSKKKINNKLFNKNNKIKILVASHCLMDSPHAFGPWHFSDFTEWLEFLGKISLKTNYDWYIKPHPNDMKLNYKYINSFLNRYKKFKLINAVTSHHSLKNNIDYVVTVWGNIAMDLALLDIPVINTHPKGRFTSFNFNYNPKTISSLKKILMNLKKKSNLKININEIYKCFYMHHYEYHNSWLIKDYVEVMRKLGYYNKDDYIIYKYWIQNFSFKKHLNIEEKVFNFISKNKGKNKFLRLK